MHIRISYPDGYSENIAVELRGFKLNDHQNKTSTPGIHIPSPPARIDDLDEVLETLINEDGYPLKGTLSRNLLVQDGKDFDFKYEIVGSYEQESERMLLKWAKIFGPGFDPGYAPDVFLRR